MMVSLILPSTTEQTSNENAVYIQFTYQVNTCFEIVSKKRSGTDDN